MGYEEQVKAYTEAINREFTQINDYNTKVVSFGYVAFFAMATYVKDQAPPKVFIAAIILMSASIALFVVHELCRALYFSRYSASKAKAVEALPEENLLNKLEEANTITYIRFQKLNLMFFWPSTLSGAAGLVMLFYCYLNMLIR